MPSSKPIQIAIIGCGAIAEFGHLPAAAHAPSVQLSALVDTNLNRAKTLAEKHNVAYTTDDYRQIVDHADAAIIALPPALHAPVAIDLMNQGIRVLVEKPMAMNSNECDQMIAAANQNNTTLAIGLVRRFRWAYRYVHKIIADGILGDIASFDVQEGGIFDWPVVSPFFLTKQGAGGGVLADAGAHVLDALLWWFGDVKNLAYQDDDFGGVEANCKLDLEMQSGVRGCVQLSRTRSMPNTTVIHGQHGTLTIEAFTNNIKLDLFNENDESKYTLNGSLSQNDDKPESSVNENVIADQMTDFAQAIRNGQSPAVNGLEGKRSVALVESCYASRKPLMLPWVQEGMPSNHEISTMPASNPATTNAVGAL